MNAYLNAMRRYADFRGRSTRAQYWLYVLVFFVLVILGTVIDAAIGTGSSDGAGIVASLVTLAHIIPSLAVTVRRLHDIDRSGWWVLIGFVPLVGLIVMLVFTCTGSTPGVNRFGAGVAQDNASGATTGPGAAPASNNASLDQIEKLAALRQSGAISEEEFQQMKAKAMAPGAK